MLEVRQVTVTGPLVVVKTDSSQAAWQVSAGLQPAQQVVVQLQPVERREGGEGGGRHLGQKVVQALLGLGRRRPG